MNAMLVALVIVAAVIRGGGLIRSAIGEHGNRGEAAKPRQQLGLPHDHRVSGLIAVDQLLHGTGVLWWNDPASATAIVPAAGGRLRIGSVHVDAEQVDAAFLAQLDPSPWPELPPQWQRLSIRHWDEAAAVYVTAGPDGLPGIAGIDDDGNGAIDDISELGATGSDDVVVAPGQSGYAQAAAGDILARIINRGALVPLVGELHRPAPRAPGAANPSAEVWLEFSRGHRKDPFRICLQVESS